MGTVCYEIGKKPTCRAYAMSTLYDANRSNAEVSISFGLLNPSGYSSPSSPAATITLYREGVDLTVHGDAVNRFRECTTPMEVYMEAHAAIRETLSRKEYMKFLQGIYDRGVQKGTEMMQEKLRDILGV